MPAPDGPEGVSAHLGEEDLRRWLTLLRRPDQLVGPEIEELLRRHGRLPPGGSSLDIGRAAAHLLGDAVERLRPPERSSRDQQLPYLVLRTCFIDGLKLLPAAARLGMSERQLSRERSRAIGLVRSVLTMPAASPTEPRYRPEVIPTIGDFLPRKELTRALEVALADHRLVHVHGPAGVGKTALVAESAAELVRHTPVFWLRFRHGVNDSLSALLFELGEHLRSQGWPRLAGYLDEALPSVDTALAARLALQGLGGGRRLLVFDDFHLVEDDPSIAGLVEEVVSRVSDVGVVTVSRLRQPPGTPGVSLAVAPFGHADTAALLLRLGAQVTPVMADTLHRWTGGVPHLVKLAASWTRTATPQEFARGTASLADLEEVQAFLLDSITELIDADDRSILDAASIFRERFTDDALAFVANRTRGEVQDASLRLVRVHIATRNRQGDCSFFHTSVRDYVYSRLDGERRVQLHHLATQWYEAQKLPDNAQVHRTLAERAAGGA
jgi:ATP/maltotriose-dependent transcriptional regulator MalT